jgi:hypothetical protein
MVACERPLRILLVCDLWQGSDSYAIARALRRAGHSVTIVSEQMFCAPEWRRPILKAARRLLRPLFARDFNDALIARAAALRPHLLFVCKGTMVKPEAIEAAKAGGAVAALWWPDVSFFVHGREIPRAVPRYDWIFTTKTFGLRDLREKFGVTRASFMPHAYHPEVHRKFPCDASDHARYACAVSFIGTWSPKKQVLLEALVVARPQIDLKIWGAQWEKAGARLKKWIVAQETIGAEYAKAIRLSKINLAILSETRPGSTSGDLITARTFHIPACGGFMLHERTAEVVSYFEEGKECAFFADADEMIERIDYFLGHPDEREAVAEAGHLRCLSSGNAVDDRVRAVLEKVEELRPRAPPERARPAGREAGRG